MKWLVRGLILIAALVVLSVVTLFALGKREGARQMTSSIEINRPPAEVWRWITEPEKQKQWIAWVVEIKPLTPPPHGVGSRQEIIMEDRNNGNTRMKIKDVVTAMEPFKLLTVQLDTAGEFTGTSTYRLTDLGGGRTRLDSESTFQFSHWLVQLLEPLIMPSARKKNVEDYARLKSLIER
jgi:uncharacterized protein YndB with AHSA1/START domain